MRFIDPIHLHTLLIKELPTNSAEIFHTARIKRILAITILLCAVVLLNEGLHLFVCSQILYKVLSAIHFIKQNPVLEQALKYLGVPARDGLMHNCIAEQIIIRGGKTSLQE